MAISGSKDCSVIQCRMIFRMYFPFFLNFLYLGDLETGKKLITRGGRKSDTSKACTRQVCRIYYF